MGTVRRLILPFLLPCLLQAQSSQLDTEHWAVYLENISQPSAVQILLSGPQAAKGTISVPQKGYSQSFSFAANGSAVVNIPSVLVYPDAGNAIQDRAVRISSDKPVFAVALSAGPGSAGAAAITGLSKIPTAPEYLLNVPAGAVGRPSMAVIGVTEDNTRIEITPSVTLASGRPPGVPFAITMNRGGSYPLRARDSGSLGGTRVRVVESCRKIVVFQGSAGIRFANEASCASSDHIYEQAIPISHWQRDYYLLPAPEQSAPGSFRVAAHRDGTAIQAGALPAQNLNRGESWTPLPNAAGLCLNSSQAVHAVQLSRSGPCNGHTAGLGDPYMLNALGSAERVKTAWWHAPNIAGVYRHYVVLAVPNAARASCKIDGNAIPAASFVPSACGAWSEAVLAVAPGAHRLECDSPVYAAAYGLGQGEAFAFSLGAAGAVNRLYRMELAPNPICHPDSLLRFALRGDTVLRPAWSLGDGNTFSGAGGTHHYGRSGSFRIQAWIETGKAACPGDTLTGIVNVRRGPQAALGSDSALCRGSIFRIRRDTPGGGSLQWNRPAPGGWVSISRSDTLVLRLRDSAGCFDTDTLHLRFDSCENETLQVPNVFTPGGDGTNDVFQPIVKGWDGGSCEIFNRWGQLIYRFDLPGGTPWNGRFDNGFEACPAGAYYYIIRLSHSLSGRNAQVNGVVHLIEGK